MSQPPPSAKKPTPIVSLRALDGTLVETLFKRAEGKTSLVALREGSTKEQDQVSIDGHQYVPFSAGNNLLTHRVVLLPSSVGANEPDSDLLRDVRAFIHRYVDLNPAFEEVSAHYVLLTWGYDAFNELPYLRVRGQYGTGKSRFLLTIGSISYKPIFASGASTISPIFRLIDQVGGTLVIDEADFWASDERSEVVKILNNGNARGFPVLRNDITPQKEFNPRAFNIFGPKIVATRHQFEDAALESRCLTETLGNRPLRPGIPISLPRSFESEAEALRNRLLAYRFRRFGETTEPSVQPIQGMTPRRAQIIAPLLNIALTNESRDRLRVFADSKPDAEDPQWNNHYVKWTFWGVVHDLDPVGHAKVQQRDRAPGLVDTLKNATLWLKTWSQVIADARKRLEFLRGSLDVQTSAEHGLAHLAETHPDATPAAIKTRARRKKATAPQKARRCRASPLPTAMYT